PPEITSIETVPLAGRVARSCRQRGNAADVNSRVHGAGHRPLKSTFRCRIRGGPTGRPTSSRRETGESVRPSSSPAPPPANVVAPPLARPKRVSLDGQPRGGWQLAWHGTAPGSNPRDGLSPAA